MKTYKVILTTAAIQSLRRIKDYIAYDLLVPEISNQYVAAIREGIRKLEYMAPSIAPVPGEPWQSYGVRRITVKKYYIYYRIDEDSNCVYVINIIYNRRNQIDVLSQMDLN